MDTGIIFTKQEDGTFKQEGECSTTHGRFQWQGADGSWDGGWTIEPLADLIARMSHGGPYKYDRYRILDAEKPELVIKPTCYGCGMIAGISCGCNPLGAGRDFTKGGDPLVDYNEDHQFSVLFPVKTEGKNFGKYKLKMVTFNSVRCANLELLRLTRTETGNRVSYDYNTQTLGEYRAAQGYKRCPTCKRVIKDKQFCDDVCESKYEGDIATVLQVAESLKESPITNTFRGRCAYKNCGQGRDERGNRERARVPARGDFCSKECRKKAKDATKQSLEHPPVPETASASIEPAI